MIVGLTLNTNGFFEGREQDRDQVALLYLELFEQFKNEVLQYGGTDEVKYTIIEPFTLIKPQDHRLLADPDGLEGSEEEKEWEALDDLQTYAEDFQIDMNHPVTVWGSAHFDGWTIMALWVQQRQEHYILFC